MTKLDRLCNRMTAEGLTVKKVTVYNAGNTGKDVPGLLVDTDYIGMYPGEDTFNKIGLVNKLCGKKFFAMQRGHYTAMLVTDNDDIEPIKRLRH